MPKYVTEINGKYCDFEVANQPNYSWGRLLYNSSGREHHFCIRNNLRFTWNTSSRALSPLYAPQKDNSTSCRLLHLHSCVFYMQRIGWQKRLMPMMVFVTSVLRGWVRLVLLLFLSNYSQKSTDPWLSGKLPFLREQEGQTSRGRSAGYSAWEGKRKQHVKGYIYKSDVTKKHTPWNIKKSRSSCFCCYKSQNPQH